MVFPAEGVSLEQKQKLTQELLRSGKPIAEINAERKKLSGIKGGKLAIARAASGQGFATGDKIKLK